MRQWTVFLPFLMATFGASLCRSHVLTSIRETLLNRRGGHVARLNGKFQHSKIAPSQCMRSLVGRETMNSSIHKTHVAARLRYFSESAQNRADAGGTVNAHHSDAHSDALLV